MIIVLCIDFSIMIMTFILITLSGEFHHRWWWYHGQEGSYMASEVIIVRWRMTMVIVWWHDDNGHCMPYGNGHCMMIILVRFYQWWWYHAQEGSCMASDQGHCMMMVLYDDGFWSGSLNDHIVWWCSLHDAIDSGRCTVMAIFTNCMVITLVQVMIKSKPKILIIAYDDNDDPKPNQVYMIAFKHLKYKVGQLKFVKTRTRPQTAWQFQESIFKLVKRVVQKLNGSRLQSWTNINKDFLLCVLKTVPNNPDCLTSFYFYSVRVNLLKDVVHECKVFTFNHKSLLVIKLKKALFDKHRPHICLDEIFLRSAEVASDQMDSL